ncbi:hypothetical protein [Streptomyces sp. NBC_01450]|uniref:hypothetical protein n=1 Tax=Streptomyces sp. NBC_01450 TaxID=2903871 RepID=UPI003FCDBF31
MEDGLRTRLRPADGTWERLLQQVQAQADAAGDLDWDISVGSTMMAQAHDASSSSRVTSNSPDR